MKESKIIIAINTDAQAPIFEIATYGLVEDLFKAIPEIEQKL
jgi:electron transfer flavoprotein alpha subunit